jgi:WD40 repeat protein
VFFSPDGKYVAHAYTNTEAGVQTWEAESGKRHYSHRNILGGHLGGAAFSPNGKLLATAEEGGLKIMDFSRANKDGELTDELRFIKGAGISAFSPDSKSVASCAGLDLHVRQIEDDVPPLQFKGHTGVIVPVAFSADGKLLAAASIDGTVILRNATQPRELGRCYVEPGNLMKVGFAQRKALHIATATDDKIRLYRVTLTGVPGLGSGS